MISCVAAKMRVRWSNSRHAYDSLFPYYPGINGLRHPVPPGCFPIGIYGGEIIQEAYHRFLVALQQFGSYGFHYLTVLLVDMKAMNQLVDEGDFL